VTLSSRSALSLNSRTNSPDSPRDTALPKLDPQSPDRLPTFIVGVIAFAIGVVLTGAGCLAAYSLLTGEEYSSEVFGVLLFGVLGLYLLRFSYRAMSFLLKSSAKSGSSLPSPPSIKVRDIPRIYSSLKRTGTDGSFAAIMPSKRPKKSQDVANLQFSIENGSIGFDWVLLSEVNIEDRDRFEALAKSRRFDIREMTMNGVQYLRTTNGNAASLCQTVLSELYSIPSDAEIDLIVEGFSWPDARG